MIHENRLSCPKKNPYESGSCKFHFYLKRVSKGLRKGDGARGRGRSRPVGGSEALGLAVGLVAVRADLR